MAWGLRSKEVNEDQEIKPADEAKEKQAEHEKRGKELDDVSVIGDTPPNDSKKGEFDQKRLYDELSASFADSKDQEKNKESSEETDIQGNNELNEADEKKIISINPNDIDMTYAQGLDDEHFWDHNGSHKEDYMRIASKIPDVQNALDDGKTLEEIKKDPDLQETAYAYFDPDNMINIERHSDGEYHYADNGRHRIMAAKEYGYEIPANVSYDALETSDNDE